MKTHRCGVGIDQGINAEGAQLRRSRCEIDLSIDTGGIGGMKKSEDLSADSLDNRPDVTSQVDDFLEHIAQPAGE